MKSVFLAIVLALGITACTGSDITPTTIEIPNGEKIINVKCPDHCFCVLTKVVDAEQFHYKAKLLCGTKEIDIVPEPKEAVDAGTSPNTELLDIINAAASQME